MVADGTSTSSCYHLSYFGAKNGSRIVSYAGRELSNDVIDWSDEGEDEDDTPRNYDILSKLAEESEDEGDQDTLQFSR